MNPMPSNPCWPEHIQNRGITGNWTKMKGVDGMRRSSALLTLTLALGTLATVATTTGCAEHRYRVYDSYHSDYHTWNADEDRYYRSWLGERHYHYVEFKAQPPDRQKE